MTSQPSNCSPGLPRPMPVWSSTRSFGVKRAASCFQLKTSDRGTTTSDGGGRRRFLEAARSPRRAPAGRAPGWSCPGPCRRPGSRRNRTPGGSGASPGRRADSREAHPGTRPAGPRAQCPGTGGAGRAPARIACRIAPRVARPAGCRAGRLASAGTEGDPPPACPLRPGRVLLQPLLRQEAEAAVAQRHEVLAAPQGGEQGGERYLLIAEGHPAVQLEPVDAGRHLDPEVARLAVQLPLGLDAPALLEERPRGLRQVACGQLQGLALAVVAPAVEADLLESCREGPLGRRVASSSRRWSGSKTLRIGLCAGTTWPSYSKERSPMSQFCSRSDIQRAGRRGV